ncbi:hypothetical protein HMPREF3180_01122 [Leptotrichia wadei]|uniref:Uncharacterized protein n=1 Tax=Leptotrichia wadei TaxID=157687 RepID=A0A134ACJ4_9FUSO|nr:hypothetical protein HMPREF3180_01122 [Leptotrichia wadei]
MSVNGYCGILIFIKRLSSERSQKIMKRGKEKEFLWKKEKELY